VEGDTIGPDESTVKRGDGTVGEPLSERLEEQFGTSVSVLLPSIELSLAETNASSRRAHLVIGGKRNTFLKTTIGV